ncbi:MAG TPA: hypothetical protein VLR94_03850, partial [Acidobacteriota bacterium]|nr:hypothetical protein [Acidobacteriota bacterium]
GRFYPVYHSLYDNYAWFTKFADPGFKYSAALTRILALYASAWTDDTLLPYRFTEIADYAIESLHGIVGQRPNWQNTESWKNLDAQIKNFRDEADRLEELRLRKAPDQTAEKVNAHLLQAFLSFSDTRLDFAVRNALIGPSEETGCNADPLPGLQRSLRAGNLDQAASLLSASFQRSASFLKAAADQLERQE